MMHDRIYLEFSFFLLILGSGNKHPIEILYLTTNLLLLNVDRVSGSGMNT